MTHSAMFVAWSPMRSKYFAIISRSSAYSPSAGSCAILPIRRSLTCVEVAVHGVVLRDDLLCQHCITFYIRVNAFRHHADGGLRHLAQEVVVLGLMAVEKADDLGDVLGLIADALHVRDHLERRGDLAQVARDRLLLKQQLEAEVFDVALLPVDLAVERRDLRGKTLVVFGQRTGWRVR